MNTDWQPPQAGDRRWVLVTDHPGTHHAYHVNDSSHFRERADAERIAAAWNGYQPAPLWRVAETVLLPERKWEDEDQPGLFDEEESA